MSSRSFRGRGGRRGGRSTSSAHTVRNTFKSNTFKKSTTLSSLPSRQHHVLTSHSVRLAADVKSHETEQYAMEEYMVVPDPTLNVTTTLNGAPSLVTSNSSSVDLFFALCRGLSKERCNELMEKSWKESPKNTIYILLQARDIRDGKGEREVVYQALMWIRIHHYSIYIQLLPLLIQFSKIQGILC